MKKIILVLLISLFITLTGCATKDNTPASVHIASNPAGASVYLDGGYEGETPLDIKDISKGKHEVLLAKVGYIAEKSDIKVEKDALFNFKLKQVPTIINEKCGDVNNTIIYGSELYIVETYSSPHRIYARCTSLNKKQEIWKYEITHALLSSVKDVKLINGNLHVSIDEETDSCYHNRNNCYLVYVINKEGHLIDKYTLDWMNEGKIGEKGTVLDYGFNNIVGGYSLTKHKYLWRKHIKGNPIIGKDLVGDYLYVFQIANSYLRIIKIEKQTGSFKADRTYPEMGAFPASSVTGTLLAEPFAIIGYKAFFSPDEEHIYCVDLDSMEVANSFDTGIYFTENKIKTEGNLLFVPGEGKTLIINANTGKIIITLNKEFDKIATTDTKIYIGVSGDKIYCFNRRGKEIPFPYSPKIPGGSFIGLTIKNDVLVATAVDRITGEPVDYIYTFNTKTNEPLFTLKNADLLLFTGSILAVTTFENSFSHKNSKLAVIDLSSITH